MNKAIIYLIIASILGYLFIGHIITKQFEKIAERKTNIEKVIDRFLK